VVATVAAVTGAVGYGGGSVLQAAAARRASGPAVVVHPLYLAGLGLDLLAWLCSLYALRSLALFTVQAVLAGSIAVTVVLARALLGERMTRRDAVATGLIAASLIVVIASAGREARAISPSWLTAAVIVAAAAVAIALAAAYRSASSLLLAALAGLAFSGAAICARSLSTTRLSRLLLAPQMYVALLFGVLGAAAYARSLERGPVGPATAVLWLVEVVAPGAVGILMLGDGVRPGWALPGGLAVTTALAGCVALSTRRPLHVVGRVRR
jgi:drug/metabolite transporter (DMT)-like permease